MLGSTQQVARVLFDVLGLTPGRKGKTGYSTDTRVLRSIRGEHEIVGVIEEWRELSKLINTYLGPLPQLISEQRRPPAHDVQPGRGVDRTALDDEPEPAGDPDPHRARPRDPLGLRRRAGPPADLRGLQPGRAAHPRPRLRRAAPARGVRPQRGHPHGDGRRGARQGPGGADEGRAQRRQDGQLRDHLRHLRVRALGEPGDPTRAGAGVHRHVPRALPARAGLHPADDRAGGAGRLRDDAARPPPARSGDPRPQPADARARRAAGGQLGHAGDGRGRDQGGDDPDPRPAARGGERRAPRAPGARRAAARGARDGDERDQGA